MFAVTDISINNETVFNLLGLIDKGEVNLHKQIEQDKLFGGYIHRKLYSSPDNTGIFLCYLYDGCVRSNISFFRDTSDPLVIQEIASQLRHAEEMYATLDVKYWFNAANAGLIQELRAELGLEGEPWKGYELTALKAPSGQEELKQGFQLKGYEGEYLDKYLTLLDRSFVELAEPNEFTKNSARMQKVLESKNAKGEFRSLWNQDMLVGLYYLKDDEVEVIGVEPSCQGQGLGGILLRDAITNIFSKAYQRAYLYCVTTNTRAADFYVKNGMCITGHAMFLKRTKTNS